MKYDFASTEWFAALHGIFAQAAADGHAQDPQFRISTCEVFFNIPSGFADGRGELAWSCVSDGPRVVFDLRERDDVDVKIRVDFGVAQASSRIDATESTEKAAQLQALSEAARREGAVVVTVNRDDGHGPSVHNIIARLTA